MSANVWFEEVNMGLVKEIKDTVRVRDFNGDSIALEDSAIVIRKPEEEFKLETFPCISIYNLNYKHDPRRYNPTPIKVSEDIPNHVVLMEDPSIPFNLNYQLDFWSKYQTDMDCMTRTWLMKHFRQFNLNVIDDGGVERSCNCLAQGNIIRSDLVQSGERLFHSIIKFQIWVELDNETRYNKPMITRLDVDFK